MGQPGLAKNNSLNVCALVNSLPKYVKQKARELKEKAEICNYWKFSTLPFILCTGKVTAHEKPPYVLALL